MLRSKNSWVNDCPTHTENLLRELRNANCIQPRLDVACKEAKWPARLHAPCHAVADPGLVYEVGIPQITVPHPEDLDSRVLQLYLLSVLVATHGQCYPSVYREYSHSLHDNEPYDVIRLKEAVPQYYFVVVS